MVGILVGKTSWDFGPVFMLYVSKTVTLNIPESWLSTLSRNLQNVVPRRNVFDKMDKECSCCLVWSWSLVLFVWSLHLLPLTMSVLSGCFSFLPHTKYVQTGNWLPWITPGASEQWKCQVVNVHLRGTRIHRNKWGIDLMRLIWELGPDGPNGLLPVMRMIR